MEVSKHFHQQDPVIPTTPKFDHFDHWLETAPDSEPYVFHNRQGTTIDDVFSSQQPSAKSHAANGSSSFMRLLEKNYRYSPRRNETGSPPSPRSSSVLQDVSSVMNTPEQKGTPTPFPHPESSPFTNPNRNEQPRRATKDISVLSTSAVLPDRLRSFFPFQHFNAMQSEAFEHIYGSDQNIVLSAPTASGKTTCFDMAIARLMQNQIEAKSFKVVYIGPTKSLCQQRAKDWNERLFRFGMRCGELTGDSEGADVTIMRDNDVIVTTPEKWDSVTRKFKDYASRMRSINLVLVDEVHLLKDDRGAILEAVITRMKSRPNIRIVAVSATILNIEEVSRWIGQPWSKGVLACTLAFGEEYRPVKLERYCYGYPQLENESDFQFESRLNKVLVDIIGQYSDSKPSLIFCSTRKQTVQAAQVIAKQYNFAGNATNVSPQGIGSQLGRFIDKSLRDLVINGVAFHHAGLVPTDRSLIEELFLTERLPVLCCTTTLAVGVNYPAHLVIIKNTQTFINNRSDEIKEADLLQMIGRAGRPQFDDSGVAVILTRSDKRSKYENLISGKEPLESRLHEQLREHFNVEIGLGTILDLDSAILWLKSTFFYVRCRSNPSYYGLNAEDEGVDGWVGRKCAETIGSLHDLGLIQTSSSGKLQTTPYGHAATKFYIRLNSMTKIVEMKEQADLRDVLETLCKTEDFNQYHLRAGEKTFYNNVVNQHSAIRFPFKTGNKKEPAVQEPWQKISLLIQAELGLADFSADEKLEKNRSHFRAMCQDRFQIFSRAIRLAKCMRECCLSRKDAGSMISVMLLERCLHARTWHDTSTILSQLRGIGSSYVRVLALREVRTFEDLRRVEEHELELWCNRSTPFGRDLLKDLDRIPQYELTVVKESHTALASQRAISVKFIAKISLRNARINVGPQGGFKSNWTTFLARTDGMISNYTNFPNSSIGAEKKIKFEAIVTSPDQVIHCYLSSEGVVGCEVQKSCGTGLDKNVFGALPGPVTSTVRRQPRISELVEEAMKKSNCHRALFSGKQETGRAGDKIKVSSLIAETTEFNPEGRNEYDGTEVLLTNPKTPGPMVTRKRKRTLEDQFSDIEFDDLELDEDDLKELDRLESPARLPNGNYRCNHLCKDRKGHLCCKEGTRKAPSKARKKSLDELHSISTRRQTAAVSGRVWPNLSSSSDTKTASLTPTMATSETVNDSDQVAHSAPTRPFDATESKWSISTSQTARSSKPSKPALIAPIPPRFTALNQPRAYVQTTKQVSFANIDEIESDTDDELPTHKNLVDSLVSKSNRVSAGNAVAHNPGRVSAESVVHTKTSTEHVVKGTVVLGTEEETGYYGDASFTFDDILESAELMG